MLSGQKTVAVMPILGICLCLASITGWVFSPTLHAAFVNYDDNKYVYENPAVVSGVTLPGITWAFTHSHFRDWCPFTMISHMIDCQLFGLKAGGHHFTNVLLHTISVILLFLVLREMTGGLWRSAFVAALFAVHPLRVESVAWIAERKDVLSGVFFMLTLAAYVRYAQTPSRARYLMVSILFACGLLSKSVLVTVPLVLLLLDYWPLKRIIDLQTLQKLIVEKIPLFLLSAAWSVVTIVVDRGQIGALEPFPLTWRMNNALVAYFNYVWQMVWPMNLAAFYPHPENRLPVWEIILAIMFLIAITGATFLLRRKRPYFITGWFWYIAMLLPVIGIIQFGMHGSADRYTYLSHIGLFLVLTWGIADLSSSWRYHREFLGIGAAIVLAALSWNARAQTSCWRDSESLWNHALAVTSDNHVAHNNLGALFERRGRLDDAISHYRQALRIRSESGQARHNLGIAQAYDNLGNAFLKKGQLDDAIAYYEKAVQLRPDFAKGRYDLGNALLRKGKIDEAITQCRTALSIEPQNARAGAALGNALLRKGEVGQAITYYERSLEMAPGSVATLNNLGWVLSTCPDASVRNGVRAIELAKKADQYSQGKNPTFIRTLAAAYAETGRFNDAIETARRGLQLAVAQRDSALASQLQMDIDLYETNFPFRDRDLANAQAVQ